MPFLVHIPTQLGDKTQSVEEVVSELTEEAPGILQDLVAAVGEWRAAGNRLVLPKAVVEATKQYLDNQDPLVEWMATSCQHTEDGRCAGTQERPFKEWYWSFRVQSGRDAKQATETGFAKQLVKHKFDKRGTAKGPRYTGPMLTAEAAMEASDAILEWETERLRQEVGRAGRRAGR